MTGGVQDRNGLICFTNCKLALEDGSIVQRDLWIDEEKGIILDAQKTFFAGRRPDTIIDLGGDILSPGFIDSQINGAYGFDFSLFHNEDANAYDDGLRMIAKRIVETGVTSLLPTIITQQRELYPKLLPLLAPASHPKSATLLGWHAEGPFLQHAKRGAHTPSYLLNAPEGISSFEDVYGASALRHGFPGVRVITVAPEIEGVVSTIGELSQRGVVVSIGHSIASSEMARDAVHVGARLITHLFNAMPQLHHRDPSIIGLLGASESAICHVLPGTMPTQSDLPSRSQFTYSRNESGNDGKEVAEGKSSGGNKSNLQLSEALAETATPPESPLLQPDQYPFPTFNSSPAKKATRATHSSGRNAVSEGFATTINRKDGKDQPGSLSARKFGRPFYGIIVDGCHSHPHSVRLAYTAHPEGCILITDAMPMLDPHLKDGIHNWRDGKRLIKEGVKLYIEGTDTLAGSVVTLDICVRNFAKFTGCDLGHAIKCATYNPAACLNIENHKGTLRPGADADLVLLDAEGYVKGTWVSGKKVWPVEQ